MTDLPTPEQAARLLSGRRTINRFRSEIPPRELLEQAVDIARWAPNHHMTQPWRFYLLDEQSKQRIVELNADIVAQSKGEAAARVKRRRWSAIPGWLVVTCMKSDDALQAREDYAACCCAVHNLTLYLWSLGIGCKWTTGAVTRDARFYQALDIDADREDVVSLLWYGYPDHNPKTRRKPLEDIFFTRD